MNEDVILVNDEYYILAKSSYADDRTRVLKEGDTFGVFDRYGDVQPIGLGEQGLYHDGTRFLSRLSLTFDNRARPLLLSSSVREDNLLLAVDLANPDLSRNGHAAVPRGTVHVYRSRFLWKGVCHESVVLRNYGEAPVQVGLRIHFEADFRDIFEVRGMVRAKRGRLRRPVVRLSTATLAYDGLDGVTRRLRVTVTPRPAKLTGDEIRLVAALRPRSETRWDIAFACEAGGPRAARPLLDRRRATQDLATEAKSFARVDSDGKSLNAWLRRSVSDLCMMTASFPTGVYPYAGVPWFSVPFGRDGIFTALECLWINPSLARGVLGFLADTQARRRDPARDAEPGKILHEMRRGEMAALREIPFDRYYGSVDATPLFVMLAGAYHTRTGDLAFLRSLWPALERALGWIDQFGSGFCDYCRETPRGLANQGWRDSGDAVWHENGALARPPLALCEVQGYVYAARLAAAGILEALFRTRGARLEARRQRRLAEALRRNVEDRFWMADMRTYALALDRRRRPCRVVSSCPGHLLFAGLPSPDRAALVASTLMDAPTWSGWGIRTVASGGRRYNPMSYHNGSVWPHDNAVVAAGLARYGFRAEALRVFDALFDATAHFEGRRMPELFCGFHRRAGEAPTLYPVACAPQSWAAGAVFLLLESVLGLSIDAPRRRVQFTRPVLPGGIDDLHISGLEVAGSRLDLELRRPDPHATAVAIQVLKCEGPPIEVLKVS